MSIEWNKYRADGFYDELIQGSGVPRQAATALCQYLSSLSDSDLRERKQAAELAIQVMGITFTVYGEGTNIDRAWPFDIIPRIISKVEWDRTEAGLTQRVTALNMFINDLYHEQRVIKAGIFPIELLKDSQNFRPQCVGIKPPLNIWAHICGSDLVRDKDGTLYVLEDKSPVGSILHARKSLRNEASISGII